VCPAAFDLGQHYNIVLLSVTEGDDKPEKYPVMFRAADLLLLSKGDLLRVLDDFDPERAEASLRTVANDAQVVPVSVRDDAGLDHWLDWLSGVIDRSRRQQHSAGAAKHTHAQPSVASS
jgi:hydrogenase nickel incorporation protein HypB